MRKAIEVHLETAHRTFPLAKNAIVMNYFGQMSTQSETFNSFKLPWLNIEKRVSSGGVIELSH